VGRGQENKTVLDSAIARVNKGAADGGGSLDLVVDDGSRTSAHTRDFFGLLFPRLHRGGCCVVENLGLAYRTGAEGEGAGGTGRGSPSSRLVEILIKC
jgi:hypothetical protein